MNRQSAAKNHFKTVRRRLSPETLGISPETPGFGPEYPELFPRDFGYEIAERKLEESMYEK